MQAILNFDSSILLWIQEAVRSDAISPVMRVITHLGDKAIFWVVLALILMVFRKTRRMGVTCAAAILIGYIVSNLIIKNLAARVRPYELIEGLERIVGAPKDTSFPSGHATNSLAGAWVIFRMAKPRYGVPALVLAVLISLSRLYVGVHYPTDVLAGAVIGILSAVCALRAVPALARRFPAVARILGD